MEITYLGHSSFRIKGKRSSLITDPYDDQQLGFKFPKVEAEIVTISHDQSDHNAVARVAGEPFVITGPGEYEIGGVSVFGIETSRRDLKGRLVKGNTVYIIEIDGLRICHLGDLGDNLSDEQLGEINGVDILMVPVGGVGTLSSEQILALIGAIEPSIVFPMHYKVAGMSGFLAEMISLKDFLKLTDQANIAPIPKITVSKDNLSGERRFVVLERKV